MSTEGKWKALDQIDTAIKCLIPNPETKDSVFGEKNETKVLQSLRHPNLVLMFGAGNFSAIRWSSSLSLNTVWWR